MKEKILKELEDFSVYMLDVTFLGTVVYWGIKAIKFVADDID